MTPLRLVLVDDDVLVRSGLRVLLDSEPDLTVVGDAGTGREGLEVAAGTDPDVVVMDVRMPDMDGIAATAALVARDPVRPRVLVLTTFEDDDYLYRALAAGASLYDLDRLRARAEQQQDQRQGAVLAAHALVPASSPQHATLAQQLNALGHPGDVWLAFSMERNEPDLLAATQAARELDLTLVAFTGEAASVLGPQLRDTDVWVPLPGTQAPTLFALGWLALHGLCAAVDNHLLGEAE